MVVRMRWIGPGVPAPEESRGFGVAIGVSGQGAEHRNAAVLAVQVSLASLHDTGPDSEAEWVDLGQTPGLRRNQGIMHEA
jgi:hypothetical protein